MINFSMKHYFSFIGGENYKGRETKEVINPSTGEPFALVDLIDSCGLEQAVDSARDAYDKGPWPQLSFGHRKGLLLKLASLLLEKAQELANLESRNTGKPIKETTFMDIPSAAETFKFFGENLENFLKVKEINLSNQVARAKATLIREPLGVTGLIVPWNYPLLIASWKTAQSLAAGNTVVLKPSSLTPLTALELGRLAFEAGLPKGVLNVVICSGQEAGLICQHPKVDLVSFTGSNLSGEKIVASSAKNIKKTIIELGGRSANIVLEDADLDLAVNGVLCSIFLNQGQMCTAASRVLVAEKIYQEFKARLKGAAEKIKLGDALDFETQMGPLASKGQQEKMVNFFKQASLKKSKIITGGKIPTNPGLEKGFFFQPSLIEEDDPKSFLFQEEIFGPAATLTPFSSLSQAVSLANDSRFGLAACIWSRDELKVKEIAGKVSAGIIWANTYGMFFNQIPFGGFKQSGFGKELGEAGFWEYTRLKSLVLDDTAAGSKPLVNYWYGF